MVFIISRAGEREGTMQWRQDLRGGGGGRREASWSCLALWL